MATPFVPVPVPMEGGPGRSGKPRRPQRASSVGSVSSSSESPRGHVVTTPPVQCHSPVTRARLTGDQPVVEFSTSPHQPSTTSPSSEERPITPTVLGYEVMEERAKFTVNNCSVVDLESLIVPLHLLCIYMSEYMAKQQVYPMSHICCTIFRYLCHHLYGFRKVYMMHIK